MLKRDALMAQNLKLLGFSSVSVGTTTTVRGGVGTSAGNAQATEVHPNMFDRPNEKVLFRVLHFLLLKLKPHAAQVPIHVYYSELCYVDIVCFICLIVLCLCGCSCFVHSLEYAGISLLLADHNTSGQNELQESCSGMKNAGLYGLRPAC